MFPVIIKVSEVLHLRRLENFTNKKVFSYLQYGFAAGSGCSKAYFVIMETINHIKEREGKGFPVTWTYVKHLTQCGLMDCFINCPQSLDSSGKCLL